MNLVEYRRALRLDLKDGSTLWGNDELDRCVVRAVADLSRFLSEESIYETTLDFDVSGESSTAPAAGTWKDLANKPIKPGSETITDNAGSTTYTRDTDYTIDYSNGRYTIITAGSISESDTLKVSYTKSRLGIDLSAILSSLIRIVIVEYPTGKVPQQFVSFNIWGDFMYIGSQKLGSSQTQLIDKEHVAIYYQKEFTAPTADADGSYEEYLDQVICIGAAAYALLIKAIQYEHQAVTDLASSRTALGNLSTIHTAVGTALGNIAAIHSDIGTALDKVTTYTTDADTALDAFISKVTAIETALGKVDTYLAGDTDSTKAILAQIATDIADLRSAIETSVDAAKSYLDEVDTTDLQGAEGVWTEEVKHILTAEGIPNAEDFIESGDDSIDISGILTDIEIALDKIATEIAAGKAYLEAGDDKIDTVNIGDSVPELHRDYANVQVALGAGYRQEASERLGKAQMQQQQAQLYLSYANAAVQLAQLWADMRKDFLTEASARTSAALGYVQEAAARLDNLRTYLEQGDRYAVIAGGFIDEAEVRLNIARGYVEESIQRLGMSNSYVDEANGRIAQIDRYIAEANVKVSQLTGYLNEASQYSTIGNLDITLAEKFREEGIERRNEFWSILRDKAEYRKRLSSTPVRQA